MSNAHNSILDGKRRSGRAGLRVLLAAGLLMAGWTLLSPCTPAFDLPPFDTGHNFTGNPGGPGGGGGDGGGGGGDPIILKTGNFSYQTVDWSFHGRGWPLQIKRAYNSDDFFNAPFGFGWHLEILWSAVPVESATQSFVIVRRDEGRRVTFTQIGPGQYVPQPGHYDTLVPDGPGWRVTTGGGVIYRFNAAGWPTRGEKDGQGVNFSYDSSGRLASLTSDASQALYFEYGSNRRIRRIYDWTGRETRYEYDTAGNLTGYIDRGGYRMEYQYDDKHNLLERKSRRGYFFPTNEYDDLRRVTFQQYADGRLTMKYDPAQSTTTLTDQSNKRTTFKYNDGGKPVEIKDPDNNYVRFTWDANFNRTSFTDTNDRVTNYTYDAQGRLASVVLPNGAGTFYSYHPTYGLLSSVTTTNNLNYSYQYDAGGRLMQVTMPGGQNATFSYAGNQVSIAAPGLTSVYTLNGDGWIASAKKGSGPTETYSYDAVGNLAQSSRPGASLLYAYTARDRLAAATETINSATYFFYNEEDSLARVVYPDGSEDIFEYDQYNRLSNTSELSGKIVLLSYNPTDAVEQEFLSTVGNDVGAENFDRVWDWGAVLAGLP